jgi:hypothetical protein
MLSLEIPDTSSNVVPLIRDTPIQTTAIEAAWSPFENDDFVDLVDRLLAGAPGLVLV